MWGRSRRVRKSLQNISEIGCFTPSLTTLVKNWIFCGIFCSIFLEILALWGWCCWETRRIGGWSLNIFRTSKTIFEYFFLCKYWRHQDAWCCWGTTRDHSTLLYYFWNFENMCLDIFRNIFQKKILALWGLCCWGTRRDGRWSLNDSSTLLPLAQ